LTIEFELKTKVKIGECEYLNLPKYIAELKYKKIGLIFDKNLKGVGYVDEIIDKISKEFSVQSYTYCFSEPTYDILDTINEIFCEEKIDVFVAIGGGSVIDLAKGLATLSTNPGKAIQYRGFPTDINPPKPVIAVPTTAGTGSEVTYNAVFVDTSTNKKLGINTKLNFPVLAILDPALIISAPKKVMLSSGLDALVHAVESYGNKKANEITKLISRQAIHSIYHGLIDFALWEELDRESRIKVATKLQIGAYLAGISLMNSGSGPAGAFS
jgi:alcohol dehydrogenase class IV